MNLLGSERFLPRSSSSIEEDFLIKNILLTHDPDDRRLDSELLLRATESIMCYVSISEGSDLHLDTIARSNICNIEVIGSEEPLGHTIYKISCELLYQCYVDGNLHAKTMILFDMLGHYRWEAKLVLVLAAFAMSYGEFWLIVQLYPRNPLAASVAMLKQLPNDLSKLRPRFKALSILVKTMVDVTKCIMKFEGLRLQQVVLDNEAMAVTKSQIYMATYWIIRSTLTCSSQIKDLKAINNEHSNSSTVATWELSSLVCRLSSIFSRLRWHVDVCHQLIETQMHSKLWNVFKETNIDNQEVLNLLFALKDDFPLKDCSSQAKLGVSELKNKVVLLLVSKPELLPIEELLLLVQQTCDHPHQEKLKGSYEIVWVPIPSSTTWSHAEETSFNFLSHSLPWHSVRQPWLLSSTVVNFIKQMWSFKEEPLMVVLDSQGMVTNTNAIDMLLIWGARAYPFSASREKELWEEQNWTLQLLIDGIDPLLAKWVEEERNFCIYGSDNLDWIRKLNAKLKEITSIGVQVEMLYVGKKNPTEHARDILATIDKEKKSVSLTFTKMQFFWLRLESMRRSKLRLGYTYDNDFILGEASGLLDTDDNDKGWIIMGRGGSSTDIIKLQGEKVMEGLVGAIRTALEPPLLEEGTVVCNKCKRPMQKFIVYKCNVTE